MHHTFLEYTIAGFYTLACLVLTEFLLYEFIKHARKIWIVVRNIVLMLFFTIIFTGLIVGILYIIGRFTLWAFVG
jgi:hypothetical protein